VVLLTLQRATRRARGRWGRLRSVDHREVA